MRLPGRDRCRYPPIAHREVLNWRFVKPGIIIPVVLILVGLVVFWRWYRWKLADLAPDAEARPLPGARLTADRLRALASPPWRVVYEAGGKLGDIDHVVIGPTGVIAIETMMFDRPDYSDTPSVDPQLVASAAIARGTVDDVTRPFGVPCTLHAKVFWGVPQPDRPAAIAVTSGQVAVEGQRLPDWVVAQPPGSVSPAQVDQLWQALLTSIGRPDPL